MNLIYLILFFTSTIIVILSYGVTTNKFLKLNSNSALEIGDSAFIGISFILGLSILIHFFIPINYYVSTLFYFFGFVLFIAQYKTIYKILIKINLKIYLLLLFLSIPFILIKYFHDDYNYYHLPYLNVIFDYKIIFGLANINTVLTYPQNTWLDFVGLFRIPILDSNVSHILNATIFIFFILFNIEKFNSSQNKYLKIYSVLLIIFSLSIFSRLRDHGLEISPQFILLIVSYLIIETYLEPSIDLEKSLKKILILCMTAILLRISSISIIPVVFIICLKYYKETFNIIGNKKFLFYCIFISLIYFSKNIITSGCVIYPISQTCFNNEQISWTIGKKIPQMNKDILHSFSRGWMFYAKEKTKTKDKFIFNPTNNISSHKEYLKKSPKKWAKYWIKDPDTIRILNLIIISFFILIVFLIFNFNKFTFLKFKNESKSLLLLFLIFLPQLLFWFFISTPSLRIGGYASILPIFIIIILLILNILLKVNFLINKSLVFLILISILYFSFKNVSRVYKDFYFEKNEIKYPWPQHNNLIKNLDFKTLNINGYEINLRLPTNKLLAGNLNSKNNYILHCGNIKMPCMPEKKIKCINNIKKINGYLIITNNNNECLKLMNEEHALY